MNKSQILVAGLGQCGGILADEMKKKNKRYTTIYINSSLGDIQGLKFADIETNVFIYSGADGSGRNREKAKKFIDNDRLRIASFLKKFRQFNTMLIFTSLDGGTGSGSVAFFIKLVKTVLPDLKINLVGVLPKLSEQDLQLTNTLDCYNELGKVFNLINDIKFINNNKRDESTYNEINEEAIYDIDMSYGMVGHSQIGSIDEENLEKVCTSHGYGVILKLPKGYKDIRESIDEAKEGSIFSLPPSLDCLYGAVNVIKDNYNVDRIVGMIDADKTIYKCYNEENNLICLGGCEIPTEDFEYIDIELEDRKNKKSKLKRNKSFSRKFETNNTVEKELENKNTKNNNFTKETDFDEMIEDDNFFKF